MPRNPTRSLPDPYAVGAALLVLLLETGGEQIGDLAVDGLAGALKRLRELQPFGVAG